MKRAKQPMKGVNLGGWLVLEPWITPSLFKGTAAEDEFSFVDTAGSQRMHVLHQHRKTFITRQDFVWLAEHGIEAVRIPVGHWIFGDHPPYIGGIDFLDQAFGWAEETGIKVLLCLHGAPGSQNGEMHSGRKGEIGWLETSAATHIEESLQVLKRLAQRYAEQKALLGVELLNEPSAEISKRTLTRFYRRAYKLVRRELGKTAWIVMNDGYRTKRWQWTLHRPRYRKTYQDVHYYQVFSDADKALDVEGHLAKAAGSVRRQLRWLSWHRQVVIGEWSAALDSQSLRGLSESERQKVYAHYIATQLETFQFADAWFFWTYKTEGSLPWDFRRLREEGFFPDESLA